MIRVFVVNSDPQHFKIAQVHRMMCIRAQTIQLFKVNSQLEIPSLEHTLNQGKNIRESVSEPANIASTAEIKRNEDDITTSLDISSHSTALSTSSSFYNKDETSDVTSSNDRHSIHESHQNTPTSSIRLTSIISKTEDPISGLDFYDKSSALCALGEDNYYLSQERIVQEQAIIESMLSEVRPISNDPYVENHHRIPIHGNLARELAETFYCLSLKQNDELLQNENSPTISSSSSDGIVYINNHIAITIEPAFTSIVSITSPESKPVSVPWIRSYHTLIFSDYSPTDILQRIQAIDLSDSSISQHTSSLVQLLQAAGNPFESLFDLSVSTALPLTKVLDAALTLVRSGYCILAPGFQRSSTAFITEGSGRHATLSSNLPQNEQIKGSSHGSDGGLKQIRSLSLAFSQRFGPYIPMFLVVSLLTTPFPISSLESIESLIPHENEHERNRVADRDNASVASDRTTPTFSIYENEHSNSRIKKLSPIKLGHILKISSWMFVEERHDTLLKQRSTSSPESEYSIITNFSLFIQLLRRTLQMQHVPVGFRNTKNIFHQIHDVDSRDKDMNAVEGAIISMITWLYAKKVITFLKKYLVPVNTISRTSSSDEFIGISQSKTEQMHQNQILYQQVMDMNYLTSGMVSDTALAWRCGWSTSQMEAFEQYVLRYKNFLLVIRSHCEGDDWGSP